MKPPPTQQSRINLADLKSQIARRLGPDRAQRYFILLNRLLVQKLSKSEFDRHCFATLGRENIPLHNQLIRSILKNACQAKVPPPVVHERDSLKPIIAVRKKSPPANDGFHPSPAMAPTPQINGDILPPSPRKCRTAVRDRRLRDRPSPLGPNGKADVITHQSLMPSDEAVIRENGSLVPCDLKRPVQQAGFAELPVKKQRVEKSSPCDQVSVHSRGPADVVVVEEGEEVEQTEVTKSSSRVPLQAPLGIPFCPASVGGARRPLSLPISNISGGSTSYCYSGELCHTETLRKHMEQITEAQGLGSVTTDCANLLNNGLDAYLKQLIRSCVELAGARSGYEPVKQPVSKQPPHRKITNGIWPGIHMHVQSSSGYLEGIPEQRNRCPISLLDFKVAMELNPQQLGEDRPLLLEKICLRSFEE